MFINKMTTAYKACASADEPTAPAGEPPAVPATAQDCGYGREAISEETCATGSIPPGAGRLGVVGCGMKDRTLDAMSHGTWVGGLYRVLKGPINS